MVSEYVKISASESYYGQKNLLHAQLELLDLIKRIRNFKSLRDEELMLKVTLKSKAKEVTGTLEALNRTLPVSHYKEYYELKREAGKKKAKREKHFVSLQQEIEDVRSKLARLQNEA